MMKQKMRLKGCPRCGGDLMPDRSDSTGDTYGCLQCGRDFTRAQIGLAPALVTAPLPVPVPVRTAA